MDMRNLIILTTLFLTCSNATSYAIEKLTEVRVAVAANFTVPFEKISAEFTKTTGHPVVISSGSSGKFFTQIENDAPFDLFLSADQNYPKMLVEKKLGEPKPFTYAIGKLVLWSSDPSLLESTGSALKNLNFKHLAIANPKLAPYGLAAEEVLKKLNLWDKIQSRIVMGENVTQTHQFVSTGNAELGFVPYSEVINVKTGSMWIVPSSLYSPIRQDAVILSKSKTKPGVKALFEYLKGKESKAIIRDYGYTLP